LRHWSLQPIKVYQAIVYENKGIKKYIIGIFIHYVSLRNIILTNKINTLLLLGVFSFYFKVLIITKYAINILTH